MTELSNRIEELKNLIDKIDEREKQNNCNCAIAFRELVTEVRALQKQVDSIIKNWSPRVIVNGVEIK